MTSKISNKKRRNRGLVVMAISFLFLGCVAPTLDRQESLAGIQSINSTSIIASAVISSVASKTSAAALQEETNYRNSLINQHEGFLKIEAETKEYEAAIYAAMIKRDATGDRGEVYDAIVE